MVERTFGKIRQNWPKVDDVICARSLIEPNGPPFLYAYELHEPNEYLSLFYIFFEALIVFELFATTYIP